MSHDRPATLGESLYENPLQGPDGTIRSAFADITDAEARARQSIWDWESAIPSDPALIADEILATGALIDRSSPRMAQRLERHCRRLAGAYNEHDGSAVLLYLSHFLPLVVKEAEIEQTPEKTDPAAIQSIKIMQKVADLHAPLGEQEQKDRIESDVLPPMLDSFEMFYRVTGLFTNLQKEVPKSLGEPDEAAISRFAHVMHAYAKRVNTYDFSEFAGWLGQKGKLPLFNRNYYQSMGAKLKERDIMRADHRVLELAAMPVSGYFKVRNKDGDSEFDFDKLRKFIDYCQAQDDSAAARQGMSYQEASQVAGFFVCEAQSSALIEQKRDIGRVLAERMTQMQRHGLSPMADAMVFAYEFVSERFL